MPTNTKEPHRESPHPSSPHDDNDEPPSMYDNAPHGRSRSPEARAEGTSRGVAGMREVSVRSWMGLGSGVPDLVARPRCHAHVLSFKRPRETVQKLLQRDMKVLEKPDKNIKIAFLTRLLTIIGRRRWDKQRRALKYTATLAPSAGKRARVTFVYSTGAPCGNVYFSAI